MKDEDKFVIILLGVDGGQIAASEPYKGEETQEIADYYEAGRPFAIRCKGGIVNVNVEACKRIIIKTKKM